MVNKKMEERKFEPTDFESKLRKSIVKEFEKVCPYIRVKEEDFQRAKDEVGLDDETIIRQFLANCIDQLHKEIFGQKTK